MSIKFDLRDIKFIDSTSLDPIKADKESVRMYFSDTKNTSKGLIIKAKASHALKPTGNYGIYLPKMLKLMAKDMTTPYPKPILSHHQEKVDAIGRVKEATYVPTYPPQIPKEIYDQLQECDAAEGAKIIRKIKYILEEEDFEGIGYIDVTGLIVDPVAAQKVIDQRYLTMSIGYTAPSETIYNSVTCYPALHEKNVDDQGELIMAGHDQEGETVYWIFDTGYVNELSYVNKPADDVAMTYEYKFEDNVTKTIPYNVKYRSYSGTSAYLQQKSENGSPAFKIYDSVNSKQLHKSELNGGNMKSKLTQLLDDEKLAYEAMKKFLPADQALTDEAVEKLDSKVFVGPKRTFPVINEAHKEAALKVLESFKSDKNPLYKELVDSINGVDLGAVMNMMNGADAPAAADAEKAPVIELTDEQLFDMVAPKMGTPEGFSAVLAKFTDEQLKTFYDSLQKLLVEKKLISLEADNQIAELKDQLAQSDALNEVYVKRIGTLQNSIEFHKQAAVKATDELKKSYTDQIMALKAELGFKIDDAAAETAELSKRTMESLTDSLRDLSKQKDVKAKASQTAEGSLTDPTNGESQASEALMREFTDALADVESKYETLKLAEGRTVANQWKKLRMEVLRQKYPNLK